MASKPIQHGTLSAYRKHKCRCDECKAALTEYHRRWREAHPDYRTERTRQPSAHGTIRRYTSYKCRCDECQAAAVKYRRRWKQANPDAASEAARRWRENNAERAAEQARIWREANPEKVAEYTVRGQHRRRARMVDAFVEEVPRLEIFERDGWQCQITGCLQPGVPASLDVDRYDPLWATIDHVIPLSKGGTHERSNAVTAHFRCNCAKGAREGIA